MVTIQIEENKSYVRAIQPHPINKGVVVHTVPKKELASVYEKGSEAYKQVIRALSNSHIRYQIENRANA